VSDTDPLIHMINSWGDAPFHRIDTRGADTIPGIGEAITGNIAQVHEFGASYMQDIK
jgi:hypothetical protein